MADLYFSGRVGQTITAKLYANGATLGADIAMTEIEGTGEYTGSVPAGTPAGQYLVVFFAGPRKLASGVLAWDGSKEITISTNARVLTQIQTRVDSELARLRV